MEAVAGGEEEEKSSLSAVAAAAAVLEEVAVLPDYRNAFRKQFCSLARRIQLLGPMFDELRESHQQHLPDFAPLIAALNSTKELLVLGSSASKIFLVLDRDNVMRKFQEVTTQLQLALNQFSLGKLDISDEVREQVELVHGQLRRAKERVDVPDVELYNDLLSVYNRSNDTNTDPEILGRLAEKLQLTTISDLKQESLALHEMVVSGGGEDPEGKVAKMSTLLKKIKDYLQIQHLVMVTPAYPKVSPNGKPKAPVVPDDFRCPISLELMKDPVIVATGQTYERAFIEKWLDAGHDRCPKTQQKLTNTSLTPNYVLRSLIAQWCEANGLDPPKSAMRSVKPFSRCSSSENAKIDALLQNLSSSNIEDQRSATCELRLLAKCSTDNRICIAEAGAIPLLVGLLYTVDAITQEHAVTALLNLSICEENKGSIIYSNAVPGILHVLRKGTMQARENAAATLFSLSVVDEYKVTIGASGAIPALVVLLSEGNQRGKKDAATALFNLCIYQGNKARAIRAGLVPILMELLTDAAQIMVDESLAILAILASHPEGKAAIGAAEAVPALVQVIGSGLPRNRENAAAILVHLFGNEQQHQYLAEAQERGVMAHLQELAQNGTDRGKRKALLLIERMNRFLEQQKQAQTEQLRFPSPPSLCNR